MKEQYPTPENEALRPIRDPETGKLLARVDPRERRLLLFAYRYRAVWVSFAEILGDLSGDGKPDL